MAFCQSLTTRQDFAIFTPSWQAGVSSSQCLPKSLKNNDIESINIVKTCEKLGLALNENLKQIQATAQSADTEKQCAIRKPTTTFRDFSNIWFGTLKIYQQQVNTLFRLSQDLFSRSRNYNVKRFDACKRNSSLTSEKPNKKRRLKLNESYTQTCSTTNYTQLLDDLEDLTREPTITTVAEEESQNVHCSVTQFQIREITLREISAPMFNHSDEMEEDSGFGEATHEEIAEFFNFTGDKNMLNMKRTTAKRKMTIEQSFPFKKSCLINDYIVEPIMANENMPFEEHNLKKSLKRSLSSTCSEYKEKEDVKSMNLPLESVLDTNDYFETDKIKKENIPDVEYTMEICAKKKRRNLIIDNCIKIDVSDILEAMKNCDLLTKQHTRKRTLKLNKSKRNLAAFELLTRFNRRSLKLSLSFKQKFFLSRDQFQRDYLNLLREIFKTSYIEEWASKIYPKWISFGNDQYKQNKKQRFNKHQSIEKVDIQHENDFGNFKEAVTTNLAHDNYNEAIPTVINTNMDMAYDEWHPRGVMLKLFNLWSFNQTNKVAAYTLFKLAKSQIDRSLGFNSLLHLSKKRFVKLSKFPESIQLQDILVGQIIEKNLSTDFM